MTAQEFRSIRLRLGLTQPQLAAILDVSERMVRAWDSGVMSCRVREAPHAVSLLLRLMVTYEQVRQALGVTLENQAGDHPGVARSHP